MSFNPATPVTGGAQTGLTAPTYTLTTDTAPASNAKQWAITALGGTQTGVDTHSVARPFTLTMFRPTVLRSLGSPNPVTGRIAQVPTNTYTVLTRKGVTPLAGQPSQTLVVETRMSVPAGSDLADPANIRAALSLHFGAVWAQSAGLGDTTVSGII
jgi:hypothetical protein